MYTCMYTYEREREGRACTVTRTFSFCIYLYLSADLNLQMMFTKISPYLVIPHRKQLEANSTYASVLWSNIPTRFGTNSEYYFNLHVHNKTFDTQQWLHVSSVNLHLWLKNPSGKVPISGLYVWFRLCTRPANHHGRLLRRCQRRGAPQNPPRSVNGALRR